MRAGAVRDMEPFAVLLVLVLAEVHWSSQLLLRTQRKTKNQ